MSDKQQFKREIKRTGYLRGTQMRKVRTKVLVAVLGFTVVFYAGAYFFMKLDKDKTYNMIQREKQWKAERERRLAEVIQMSKELNKGGKTGAKE